MNSLFQELIHIIITFTDVSALIPLALTTKKNYNIIFGSIINEDTEEFLPRKKLL